MSWSENHEVSGQVVGVGPGEVTGSVVRGGTSQTLLVLFPLRPGVLEDDITPFSSFLFLRLRITLPQRFLYLAPAPIMALTFTLIMSVIVNCPPIRSVITLYLPSYDV